MLFKVKTIKRIEKLLNIDLLEIVSEDGNSYYAFENYADVVNFVGEEVECILRKDYIKGKEELIISDLTLYRIVPTIIENSDFKLYSTKDMYTECTLYFKEDNLNSRHISAIVFVSKCEYKISAKAEWLEFIILDKEGRYSTLYWFSPKVKYLDCVGKYICCNLTKTQYGYQTDAATVFMEDVCVTNPNVTIAYKFLSNLIEKFDDLLKINSDLCLLDKIINYTDKTYVISGNLLIKFAYEMYLASCMSNISPILNLSLLYKTIFVSYLHCTVDNTSRLMSDEILSILVMSKTSLVSDKRILYILQGAKDIIIPEKEIFNCIQYMSNKLLDINFSTKEFILL